MAAATLDVQFRTACKHCRAACTQHQEPKLFIRVTVTALAVPGSTTEGRPFAFADRHADLSVVSASTTLSTPFCTSHSLAHTCLRRSRAVVQQSKHTTRISITNLYFNKVMKLTRTRKYRTRRCTLSIDAKLTPWIAASIDKRKS